MVSPTALLIFITTIYIFNHGCEMIWSTDKLAPEGSMAAVMIIDNPFSVSKHKKALPWLWRPS